MKIPNAALPVRSSSQTAASGQAARSGPSIYEVFQDKVQLSASSSVGATIGYAIGATAGGIANAAGGNLAYTYLAAPAAAVVGGLTGAAAYTNSETLGKTALTGGLTCLGTLAGDALGHGLSLVSKSAAYSNFGALAGALNGAALGMHFLIEGREDQLGKVGRHVMPTVLGTTTGASAGCLAGALLTSITGNPIYNVVAPALGAVSGGMTGLAMALNYKPEGKE